MSNQFFMISKDDLNTLANQISLNIKKELRLTPTPTQEDEFLTIDELTKLIGLTKPTIYGHVHRNTIPFIKKGKMLRFSKQDILNWLQAGKNKSKRELEARADEYLAKNPMFNR